MVSKLCAKWTKELNVSRDLTDQAENMRVLEIATEILASGLPVEEFKKACYGDDMGKDASPPVLLQAIQSAASKEKIKKSGEFHMACVFAMYAEQNRIQSKGGHKNGQDFLRVKVKQLQWLFDGESSGKTWELIAVDDGCPHNSKGLARMRVEVEGYKNVRVLDLEDAVRDQIPFFVERGITKGCKESRKGGAILYGLYTAAAEAAFANSDRPQLVMYTDSDLSTDMSLVGELAYGSFTSKISMGARYGYPGTFLVKPPDQGASGHPQSHYEQPNMMKIVFRHYLRTRLLPMLEGNMDTQCAFKCFRALDLLQILPSVQSTQADFDMELLLCALTHYRDNGAGENIVTIIPTLFTEDFAESNFMASSADPDMPYKTYAGMTNALIDMHERYVPADGADHENAKDLIEFGKKLDWEAYKRMILSLESKLGPTLFDYDFGLDTLKEAAGI